MILNLIFHKIYKYQTEIKDKYDITYDYYLIIIKEVNNLIKSKKSKFTDYRIYFDDGYDSFKNIVFPNMTILQKHKTTLAIVTDLIGKNGYLDKKSLECFNKCGITISSHTASHTALAVYKNNKLQNSIKGGIYQNSPSGQGDILTENEILYQFIESKNKLKNCGFKVNELVLPHGLYNDTVIRINYEYGIYAYISTCDEYLDEGQSLKPRFLIDNERSIADTITSIIDLNNINIFKLK